MATTNGQRIGIWVIAAVLVIGTVGGFLAMVLAPQNQAKDTAYQEKLTADFQKEYEAYNKKVEAQADELSKKYYEEFSQYQSRVAPFDGSNVNELKKEDLKEGTGEALTSKSTFTAYYIGWTPDGKVFDGSIENGKLKAPFTVENGSGVIEGWTKGVDGMKVGGVRELTIPAAQAYGAEKNEQNELAGQPLKFVLMVIESPEKIEAPTMPRELQELYYGQQ